MLKPLTKVQQKIIGLYCDGMPATSIAERFGYASTGSIYVILRKAGVPLKTADRHSTKEVRNDQ